LAAVLIRLLYTANIYTWRTYLIELTT